jgi:hypothetical protein
MTVDRLTRLLYSGAIGALSVAAFDAWGMLIGPAIILVSGIIGITFGSDD